MSLFDKVYSMVYTLTGGLKYMTTITLKELRPKLPQVIDAVDKKFERAVITRRGHPVAIMMSIDDYESLLETMDVLSDKAGILRIKQGLAEIRGGKTVSLKEIRRKLENV